MDPQDTELYATADFCLVPMGTGHPSVADEIAECQRVLQRSGLKYKMHGYGTNLEGPWSQVMQAIHDCHQHLHQNGVLRIATDIRIGTRIDKPPAEDGVNEAKVQRVEALMAHLAEAQY